MKNTINSAKNLHSGKNKKQNIRAARSLEKEILNNIVKSTLNQDFENTDIAEPIIEDTIIDFEIPDDFSDFKKFF